MSGRGTMLKFSYLFVFLTVLVVLYVCGAQSSRSQRITYRGPQSYSGYRSGASQQQKYGPSQTFGRRVPINDVRLYGTRRNEDRYREGLGELGALMDD
ncbi:unnamed protein product [Echinostoma caproni]|uniref:Secreted protein n=1 Tax=Echinostoma caproni TaxID=27848 RepID=A0A183AW62_9TREM|nr:unnamed protein product [Echinostoma caproni]